MEILIDKITKAINFAFKTDGTSPGLTISWISHTKMYYVSVVRWIHGEKNVVCSAQDKSLNNALSSLSHKFIMETPAPLNPMDELANLLSEKEKKEDQNLFGINIPLNIS